METSEKKKTNIKFIALLSVLLIGGGIYGTIKYIHASNHEETDNASIESNIVSITSRVSSHIKEVRVSDNQMVKKGDTLVILDDDNFKIGLGNAQAQVSIATQNIEAAKASYSSSHTGVPIAQSQSGVVAANLKAAQAEALRTQQDLNRYQNLLNQQVITRQQYEQVLTAKRVADANVQSLQSQLSASQNQTVAAKTQDNTVGKQIGVAEANLEAAKTGVDKAKLDLSYTVIIAPSDGVIDRVNLQVGQTVMAGQTLLNQVLDNNIWVSANFKETQLGKMKIGQSVEIKIDAFPSTIFKGKVTSISSATGSKKSLLPADNSSGNFVKVVQKIPVKIEFNDSNDKELMKKLVAGMSTVVEVYIGDKK